MYSISTLGLVACIWLICRFLLGARFLAVLLNPVAGIVALMALPAISVVLSPRVWLLGRVHSIWTIVVAEFVCIGVMSFIYRKHPFSTLTIAFLMLLHYGLWVLALWDRTITVPFYDLISPVAFWFSSIISAVLWLLYLKGCSPSPTQTTPRTSTSRYWVAFSAFALLFLAALLWLPGKGYALTRAKNPQSLTLQMWRSRCMGRCPVYQVTVHGNGEAEYEGSEFVRDRGPKHLILTQQQIQTILAGFDSADFFALEDSAFVFAFDTPRVGIKIDIDGKSKEVWSDTSYAGARNGPQAHFLEATHALDQIVGTNQWTECPGGRCGP
jgi:hypothetical protein